MLVSLGRRPFGLYYAIFRVDNAQKIKSYWDWSALKKCTTPNKKNEQIVFHIQIHVTSPGAIQKSNGLKVTCLMSLYFKSEEVRWDFFPETINTPPPPPPPTFEEKYLFTKCIEEFYKLLNYFSHCTYHCMFFNYKIIMDRILDIIYKCFIWPLKHTIRIIWVIKRKKEKK